MDVERPTYIISPTVDIEKAIAFFFFPSHHAATSGHLTLFELRRSILLFAWNADGIQGGTAAIL